MSKEQRDADVQFLRDFAGTQAGSWRAAVLTAALRLEQCKLEGAKETAKKSAKPAVKEPE